MVSTDDINNLLAATRETGCRNKGRKNDDKLSGGKIVVVSFLNGLQVEIIYRILWLYLKNLLFKKKERKRERKKEDSKRVLNIFQKIIPDLYLKWKEVFEILCTYKREYLYRSFLLHKTGMLKNYPGSWTIA